MFLKKECDDLGEWLADVHPLCTLELAWEEVQDNKTGMRGETYRFRLIDPKNQRHSVDLLLKFNGTEDTVRSTFFKKMQAALEEAINPPELEEKAVEFRIAADSV